MSKIRYAEVILTILYPTASHCIHRIPVYPVLCLVNFWIWWIRIYHVHVGWIISLFDLATTIFSTNVTDSSISTLGIFAPRGIYLESCTEHYALEYLVMCKLVTSLSMGASAH